PNSAGCDSTITINLSIDPISDLSPVASNVYACGTGEAATIDYTSSQDGLSYYLRDDANDTIVDGPIVGDGNAISFTTGGINSTMTYNVYAMKDVDSKGLAFHGSTSGNERVDCGNDASVQISGTQITLEAWIKPQNWVGINQGHVINKEFNGPGSDFGYMIRVGSGGDISFNLGNGNWNELTTTGSPLVLDQWQHIAATYDGAVMQIYLNGTMIASQNTSISFSAPNNNLTIGAWAGGNGSVYDGRIDEVRVWNVARSATQIQEAMDSCLTGTENGLVAYYQLEDGAGSATATDLTANGNDGTLTNMDINADWVSGVSNCATCEIEMTQTITASIVTIDNSVTNNNNVLTAGETGAAYQWLDCDSNEDPIMGETNQDYTATANGNYSVEITLNGCVDTSNCEAVTTVGLEELGFGNDFKVYPNPSDGVVNIDFGTLTSEKTLAVLSPDGKVIFTEKVTQQMTSINMADYPKGVYFLEISDGTRKSFHKIVKK
ncbi:MAG: LamG-like jellyroll fold domain-containing protein, partial [Crocinitomicaceae bacterium]